MRLSLLLPSFLAVATMAQAKSHSSRGVVHVHEKRSVMNSSGADLAVQHVEKRTLNILCSLLGIGCTSSSSSSSSSSYPSSTWKCSGSGTDGYNYDSNKNKCPSTYPSGFQYFGVGYGWLPPKSWSVPSNTWAPYSGFQSSCKLSTWWAPSSAWVIPSGFVIPSFWPSLGWSQGSSGSGSSSWPSSSWQCDGSGNDGWKYDNNGNTCPYTGTASSFLWFGSNFGWQPAKGWTGASGSWSAPSAWLPTCSKATWWAPQSSWIYPSTLSIPSFWISLGWSGYNWAPSSFVCNGSGNDGYSYDHLGNGLPSGYPSNWKYFGVGPQWQPCEGWSFPTKSWSPPGSWSPQHATWFKGACAGNWKWSVPKTFSCPTFWNASFLNPLAGILSWIL